MAQGLSAPLLPATTDSGLRWGRKSFQKSPGPVHITIHPAILPGMSREELLATLTALFYG